MGGSRNFGIVIVAINFKWLELVNSGWWTGLPLEEANTHAKSSPFDQETLVQRVQLCLLHMRLPHPPTPG